MAWLLHTSVPQSRVNEFDAIASATAVLDFTKIFTVPAQPAFRSCLFHVPGTTGSRWLLYARIQVRGLSGYCTKHIRVRKCITCSRKKPNPTFRSTTSHIYTKNTTFTVEKKWSNPSTYIVFHQLLRSNSVVITGTNNASSLLRDQAHPLVSPWNDWNPV